MSDANDRNLGLDEMTQMRGRLLDGIHARGRRPLGGVIAGAAAVVAVAVVVGVTWTVVTSRPTITAATPMPSPTISAEDVVGLWLPEDSERLEHTGAPYLLVLGDGGLGGYDGCNGFGGEWTFDPPRQRIVADGVVSDAAACLEPPKGGFSLTRAHLQPMGDTLIMTETDGRTATFYRSPAVQWRSGTTLVTMDGTASSNHESVLLNGTLARYETGMISQGFLLLGIDDGTRVVPVVFPAGTRLLDDGQGIEVEDVGTILLGEEISATGGPTSHDLWGPPLPGNVSSFAAGVITR